VVSEDLKRAMLGDEFYNRIYNSKLKTHESQTRESQPVTEELKRTMVGDKFYDQIHNLKLKTGSSQPVSEDLKKAMVGDELYNRIHGKEQSLETTKVEKLSQAHIESENSEDHKSEEHKVTLSYKPPSLGKRR